MNDTTTVDMELVKRKLTGSALTATLKAKRTNKWRVAKATGVSFQALWNWENNRSNPSDRNVAIVGTHLGLIAAGVAELVDLRKRLDEAIMRIEGSPK